MQFIRSEDPKSGQDYLIKRLNELLKKQTVLWLISGGSNIEIEINILNELEDSLTKRLNILLVDERYGPSGHKDSSYQQIITSGLNIKQAKFPDILDKNLSPDKTLAVFNKAYQEFKSIAQSTVFQAGIGDDGHIAGVLPYSPAVKTNQPVCYYETEKYARLTLSLAAIKTSDLAVAFSFGQNKLQALNRLKDGDEPYESLPSLVLREIPGSRVYNDQIEEGL